jgi:hypothetical protein
LKGLLSEEEVVLCDKLLYEYFWSWQVSRTEVY